jgi:hypothetical protein
LPEKVLVPELVTVKPLPATVPETIAPATLRFAVPARVTVTGVALVERLKPLISRVFPVPLAVNDNPTVLITSPIVNLVPVPNKFTALVPDKVTVPFPRLRLFAAVFVADPKFSAVVLLHVKALFAAFTTAEPLVLSIVAPPVRVKTPVPRALLLLMFKVPAVRVISLNEFEALKFTVPPELFTTSLPPTPVFVAAPVIPALKSNVPPPVNVNVLAVLDATEAKPTFVLNIIEPPAAWYQVLSTLVSTKRLNVCVVVELLVIPIIVDSRIVGVVESKVYELAVDENKMVPTVLLAESDTALLLAPKLLNWIMLLERAV